MDLKIQKKKWQLEMAPPTEDIVTEGQKQLKVLLDNQLQKDVTIEQQLSQKREFTTAVSHHPVVSSLSGLTTLDTFQSVDNLDSYITELKQCGLTDDEIQLKMRSEKGSNMSEKRRKFDADPYSEEQKIKEINLKIENKRKQLQQKDKFHGQKILTRHEMDLERSLLKDCMNDESKKLMSALTNVQDAREITHPDDPMNHLPEIMSDVTKSKKKRKKQKHTVIYEDEDVGDVYVNREWQEVIYEGCDNKGESSFFRGNPKNNKSKEEIKPDISSIVVQDISEEEIKSSKLSVDEIKQLPRFENYTAGTPSNILYLKNLSGKVCQEDLMSLFNRFKKGDTPEINYRLLKGRMRGQAFVTFADTEMASAALNLVNGYNLKEKNVIIQFGKQNSEKDKD